MKMERKLQIKKWVCKIGSKDCFVIVKKKKNQDPSSTYKNEELQKN